MSFRTIRRICQAVVLVFFSLAIAACASNVNPSLNNKAQQAVLPELPEVVSEHLVESPKSLVTLSNEQTLAFLAYMNRVDLQDVPRHQRLFNYLDNKVGGFDYRGDTYSASVALDKNAGNCLSLALLTTALANAAQVEIGYQKINATPVYKKQKDVLLLSHHVRTFLYDPEQDYSNDVIVFRRARLIVDYFPDRGDIGAYRVNTDAFLSMYYRNIASDNVVSGDLEKAFLYAKHALSLADSDPENINIMAVILKRMGHIKYAQDWYQYGVDHAEGNINLLSNYRILLDEIGEADKARALTQKLEQLDDHNPYAWIKAGHEAFQREEFSVALRYYEKAIARAPYLDDAYFGLARSHFARREYTQAAKAMEMAAKKAFEESDRELYYAKLATLRSMPQ